MCQCLEAWATKVYIKPVNYADFMYEMTTIKYHTSVIGESKSDKFRNIEKIPRNMECTCPSRPETIAVYDQC